MPRSGRRPDRRHRSRYGRAVRSYHLQVDVQPKEMYVAEEIIEALQKETSLENLEDPSRARRGRSRSSHC